MSIIVWDEVGKRFFETGVDRGVLYPSTGAGVPWNGLTAVNHNPSGGEARPYYIDGYKYQNRSSPDEYAATVEAYTYPAEFEKCQGLSYLGSGLSIGFQPRTSFGLCYRTKIGNDIDSDRHGYKIHMVYNVLASPSSQNYQTVGDNPEATAFSWSVTTKPVKTAGYKATPYMVVDTTKITPPLLVSLEEIIYGTGSTAPRLPSPTELITLFLGFPTLYVVDNGDGTFTVTGPDDQVRLVDPRTYEFTGSTVINNGNGSFSITST